MPAIPRPPMTRPSPSPAATSRVSASKRPASWRRRSLPPSRRASPSSRSSTPCSSVAKDGTRAAIADIAERRGRAAGQRSCGGGGDVPRGHRRILADGRRLQPGAPHKAGVPTDAYQPSRLHSIEELPLALGFALVNGGAFRKSIEDGINSGRDTDSIGVMAGAILGAMHGEAVIDAADRMQLDTCQSVRPHRRRRPLRRGRRGHLRRRPRSRARSAVETRDSLLPAPAELPKAVNQ